MLSIEHVPLIAENPTERGELTVYHPPLEIVPRTEIFHSVLHLNFGRSFQRTLPDVSLNGPAPMIMDWECFLIHQLDLSGLDHFMSEHVPTIPNLIHQPIDSGNDLAKTSWFLDPFLFDYQIGKQLRLYVEGRF